jgi:circadian clock protein KaiB
MPEPVIELALYVSPTSAACLKVRGDIENVLKAYDAGRVRFEVLDISQDVRRAEEDRVIFTPTLVKRRPGPPAWFVGDAGGQIVPVLLASCGVEKKG